MRSSIVSCEVRRQDAQQVVSARGSAALEEQPGGLQIIKCGAGPGQSCTSSSRRRASTPLPPGRLVVRRFGCTGTSCTARTQNGVGKKRKNEFLHGY